MGLIDGEGAKIKGAKQNRISEKLLAEFVGTFFLVFTVCVSVAGGGAMAPVAIGTVLGIQIYSFGTVSGGMFNPAVTLAVLLSGRGKITPMLASLYMMVQFLGALVGASIAFGATEKTFCFTTQANNLPGDPSQHDRANWGTCFTMEMFFTMALCSTVLHTGTSFDAPNHYFGLAIGGTVMAGAFACGGFDQGSFNPAVTFGVNIANYFSEDKAKLGAKISDKIDLRTPDAASWFLFLLVPFLGSVLAAAVFRGTRMGEYEEWTSNQKVNTPVVPAP